MTTRRNDYFAGEPVVLHGNSLSRPAYEFCKRCFDLCLSVSGLLLFGPLMVMVALAIRVGSRGPALYRGLRVGRNKKPFYVLKFRTMVVNAEQLGGSCTADDDKRITGIGKILRKTKLDELPQLINVLKGEMSFVGPRPELERFVRLYDERQQQVLILKPGITDFATIWDSDEGARLAGAPDAEKAYLENILPNKLRLQLKYLDARSFWVDLTIVMRTTVLVLHRALPIMFGRRRQTSQA